MCDIDYWDDVAPDVQVQIRNGFPITVRFDCQPTNELLDLVESWCADNTGTYVYVDTPAHPTAGDYPLQWLSDDPTTN